MSFPTVQRGDTGPWVRALADALVELGFLRVASSTFDQQLEEAVTTYQRERVGTGVIFGSVHDGTWRQLAADVQASFAETGNVPTAGVELLLQTDPGMPAWQKYALVAAALVSAGVIVFGFTRN